MLMELLRAMDVQNGAVEGLYWSQIVITLIRRKDPSAHQSERWDPDPHQSEKVDPDLHQGEAVGSTALSSRSSDLSVQFSIILI
jgi:hypothetical protein